MADTIVPYVMALKQQAGSCEDAASLTMELKSGFNIKKWDLVANKLHILYGNLTPSNNDLSKFA